MATIDVPARFTGAALHAAPQRAAAEVCARAQVKFQGRQLTVTVEAGACVGALKRRLEDETRVQPKRQKLLGLKPKEGTITDETLLAACVMPKCIMLMGTPEDVIAAAEAEAAAAPELVDDLLDLPGDAPVDVRHRPENVAKLARRVAAQPLKLLHPPRPGKKLLVLDIDYTLMDHRSTAEAPHELARPYLHQFLASAYEHYDIVIWSATSMKWIEVKMRELGVLGHEHYRIAALVDHGAMITVGPLPDYGVFDCKPLGYLWAQHDGWHEHNTIMFDDLRRNFVMNPHQGLRIRPFRNAHSARATDDELLRLSVYLLAIAALDDFSGLDHRRWESYRPPRAPRALPPPEAAGEDEGAP